MESPKVIIVGAGPVGLLSAIILQKSGIKFRIFEKEKERSKLSKALAIHAGTLELLEKIDVELLKKFLARGKQIREMRLGKKHKINIGIIPSKYNFILMLEQRETERILEEHLANIGKVVERSNQVIDAKNYQQRVTIKLRNSKQDFETSADYLLDCSGAHSMIRKEVLRLPFKGEKYLGKIVMGDVKINSLISQNVGRAVRNEAGVAAFVPLNEKNFFRVILIPNSAEKIPPEISLSFFKNLAQKICPEIKLSKDYQWLTSFEISKRMVGKLKVGRIFLLGDAAHIHSPIGGQGMNLGMQDAFNICHKLQRVLVNAEDEKILELYEKERLPVIKDVLRTTDFAMKSGFEKTFFGVIENFILRKIFAPIFFRSEFLQKIIFTKLSQIKSARREIASAR
jgi:2-polyprenyl-6-methoxyphenol hydroxylase-like FAD-dependent oxidoreductase